MAPDDENPLIVYKTAFEQLDAALKHQSDDVDTLRSRAIGLAGLAVVATTFVVGEAVDKATGSVGQWVLAALGGILLMSMAFEVWQIIRPRSFKFQVNIYRDIDEWLGCNETDLYMHLAKFAAGARELNQDSISEMQDRFRTAAALAVIQWVAWVAFALVAFTG